MTGDCHVRICEGLGVKFPWATRPDDLGCVSFMSKPNQIICFMNPIYFKKIELTKPARSDVGIVAKWIEEDRVSEYLFPFGICKGVAKDFFESIYCNDSDPAFCLQILR